MLVPVLLVLLSFIFGLVRCVFVCVEQVSSLSHSPRLFPWRLDLCAVGVDPGANSRVGPADVSDCEGDRETHRRAVHGELRVRMREEILRKRYALSMMLCVKRGWYRQHYDAGQKPMIGGVVGSCAFCLLLGFTCMIDRKFCREVQSQGTQDCRVDLGHDVDGRHEWKCTFSTADRLFGAAICVTCRTCADIGGSRFDGIHMMIVHISCVS